MESPPRGGHRRLYPSGQLIRARLGTRKVMLPLALAVVASIPSGHNRRGSPPYQSGRTPAVVDYDPLREVHSTPGLEIKDFAMPYRIDVDTNDLIEAYESGMSTREIAEKFPISKPAVNARLNRAGVTMRDRGSGNRMDLPVAEIGERYSRGGSENALAAHMGVSRTAIRRCLRESGVHIRNQSESERLKWSQMTAAERRAQTKPAHDASRGRTKTAAELHAAARTRQRGATHVSDQELLLAAMLRDRGLVPIHQKAVGPYNCDLAIGRVAVEVFGGKWHFHGDHARRAPKRFRYILDRGWDVIVVWYDAGIGEMTPATAEYVASFIERSERDPSPIREYRVIRCPAEFVASVRADRDERSLVLATTSPLNMPRDH